MAKFHRADSDVHLRSPAGSVVVTSAAVLMDTLPLRNTSSTLLYDLPDLPRSADVPWQSSVLSLSPRSADPLRHDSISSLCFDAGTGAGDQLEQAVRRELLTRPWPTTSHRSTGVQLPTCRSVTSPLITAGFDPVGAEDPLQSINHATTRRRFGDARNEPLITLYELGDVRPPTTTQLLPPGSREVPPLGSRGAWDGTDVGRHHRSRRRSPPNR